MKCQRLISIAAALMFGCFSLGTSVIAHAQTPSCHKTVYLSFDTGNMSVAQTVADILKRQNPHFFWPMKRPFVAIFL